MFPLWRSHTPTLAQKDAAEIERLREAVGALTLADRALAGRLEALEAERHARENELGEIRGRYAVLVARLSGALDRQARRDAAPPELTSDIDTIRRRMGR